MKIPFALLYVLNLVRKNLIKTIACILIAVVAPFLNSLKDNRNEDKIDYQYQKDGQYFYVTQDISNNEFTYEVKAFDKVPHIKNGKLISYSYNDANIGIWVAFVILCFYHCNSVAGFGFDASHGFGLYRDWETDRKSVV